MRYRYFLAAAIAGGTFGLDVTAQDLLKQQEKLQVVAMQKVETNVRDAVAEAQRLQAAGSNVRAAERLRAALRMLEDPILPKKDVDAWRTTLTSALRLAEAGKKLEISDPKANPLKEAEVARIKAMIEEEKEIRRGVDTVGSLIRAGDIRQANKEVESLAKKFPDNATVNVLPSLVSRAITLEDVKAVHARQIENIRLAMVDLQKTATMAKMDYELPADWKEITERRKVQLSPKLKAVMAALRTSVEIDKTNAPLSEVLKALQTAMGQPIVLGKDTMQEVGVDQSTPTTCSPGTSVTARTALRMALANHGLTYIIRDNTIFVVSRDKATQTMETRVYYIGDLVLGTGSLTPGTLRPGVKSDEEQTRKAVEGLIEQLKGIDPASFKGGPSDGKGDIRYHAPSKSLIVKASAEVHGMMANSFNR